MRLSIIGIRIFIILFNLSSFSPAYSKGYSNEVYSSDDWAREDIIIEVGGKSGITSAKIASISDPHEKINRKIFSFNQMLDRSFFKPVAIGYRRIFPAWTRDSIASFVGNLSEPLYLMNGILTLDAKQVKTSLSRFTINTLFGVFGLFDVAKARGIEREEKRAEDTFQKYGMPAGPYLVLPFLGPSTLRGSIGKVADFFSDPMDIALGYSTEFVVIKIIVDGVVKREYLLKYDEEVKGAALDEYTFFKSLYIQRNFTNNNNN